MFKGDVFKWIVELNLSSFCICRQCDIAIDIHSTNIVQVLSNRKRTVNESIGICVANEVVVAVNVVRIGIITSCPFQSNVFPRNRRNQVGWRIGGTLNRFDSNDGGLVIWIWDTHDGIPTIVISRPAPIEMEFAFCVVAVANEGVATTRFSSSILHGSRRLGIQFRFNDTCPLVKVCLVVLVYIICHFNILCSLAVVEIARQRMSNVRRNGTALVATLTIVHIDRNAAMIH